MTLVRAFREEDAPSKSAPRDNPTKELVDTLNNGASDVASKVQAWWEGSDEKPTIIAVGAGSLLALYFASSIIGAIDRLPLISTIFELIGLTFTGWTAYRYFLIDGEKDKMISQVKSFASKVGVEI